MAKHSKRTPRHSGKKLSRAVKPKKQSSKVSKSKPKAKPKSEPKTAFEKALVRLDLDMETAPQIHCPITKQRILPAITTSGVFVDGKELQGDDDIDYSKISTVMFKFTMSSDECYVRDDIKEKIEAIQDKLGEEGEELTDLEIIEDHLLELGSAALVLHVVWDRDHWSSCYIGLDLQTNPSASSNDSEVQ